MSGGDRFAGILAETLAALGAGAIGKARAITSALAPTTDGERRAVGHLDELLDRARLAAPVTALDGDDLRGWHLVTTGGLLLHRSPHGAAVMHGRYGYLHDQAARIAEGIELFAAVLAVWGLAPRRVLFLDEVGSRIVAGTMARLLDVELQPVGPGGGEAGAIEVIAAYDLARAGDGERGRLAERRPGEILFSHACCWIDPGALIADATTLLYQRLRAPWEPGLEQGEVAPAATLDDDAVEGWIEAVAAAATPVPPTDRAAVLALAAITPPPARGRRRALGAPWPIETPLL